MFYSNRYDIAWFISLCDIMKIINLGITKYPIALIEMDMAHECVANGDEEVIFITEHEALYSAGKSFEMMDFISTPQIPIYYPKRGGRVTVHSLGQLVIYPIINLIHRHLNVHAYVMGLQNWIINSLLKLNIPAQTSDLGVGVWCHDAKIGFIGIQISRGTSMHGLCLNISNDITLFDNIVPCGIKNVEISSICKLGYKVTTDEIIKSFISNCPFH